MVNNLPIEMTEVYTSYLLHDNRQDSLSCFCMALVPGILLCGVCMQDLFKTIEIVSYF